VATEKINPYLAKKLARLVMYTTRYTLGPDAPAPVWAKLQASEENRVSALSDVDLAAELRQTSATTPAMMSPQAAAAFTITHNCLFAESNRRNPPPPPLESFSIHQHVVSGDVDYWFGAPPAWGDS
jgi:hypothetical protein